MSDFEGLHVGSDVEPGLPPLAKRTQDSDLDQAIVALDKAARDARNHV